VDWIELAQHRVWWLAFVGTVMDLRVPRDQLKYCLFFF
jgi:hypothetical protein